MTGYKLTGLACLVAVTAACSGENAAEQIFEEWEAAVQIEQDIAEVQDPLAEREEQENELYEEMLTLNETEEIEPLSEEAISSAEERRELMEEERSIIDEAYEQFQEGSDHIGNLEEEEQEAANEVTELMDERYGAYTELYDTYMQSVDEDMELFSIIANEEIEMEELQQQHETVNGLYSEIAERNESFNNATEQFNDAKMNFYEISELQVEAGEAS
ncbi:YkyA family protein [Alkalicoccus luteus]|uniref:Cell-wall binding lipoprotein n=1 Tax=Alkalicoccus luteus TaxID=1237094 RepID=A0A969TWH0_9BACI|nr:YkyA family protein [Alkalicoccus luteus]NJP39187.1 hypothetical protein [Alkalicoccus luteus]